jgi:cell division protein FtsZ
MDMPNIDDDLDETETIPESPDVENNSEHDNLLGGLNASDRIKASSVDDDILDIPAFLRRQAN